MAIYLSIASEYQLANRKYTRPCWHRAPASVLLLPRELPRCSEGLELPHPPRISRHVAERGKGRAGAERGGSAVSIPLPGSSASLPNELLDASADAASGSSGEVTQGSAPPSPDRGTAGSQPRAGLPLPAPGSLRVPSLPSHPRSRHSRSATGKEPAACWEHSPGGEPAGRQVLGGYTQPFPFTSAPNTSVPRCGRAFPTGAGAALTAGPAERRSCPHTPTERQQPLGYRAPGHRGTQNPAAPGRVRRPAPRHGRRGQGHAESSGLRGEAAARRPR